VRSGFWQAMVDLSPEATPFLRLLGAADWSLLMCGEDGLTAEAVADSLRFSGYPKQSHIPAWLPLAVEQFSPENLRRFLIFCTGAPSLPPRASSRASRLVCSTSDALRPSPLLTRASRSWTSRTTRTRRGAPTAACGDEGRGQGRGRCQGGTRVELSSGAQRVDRGKWWLKPHQPCQ
jgi:hypothetical protein